MRASARILAQPTKDANSVYRFYQAAKSFCPLDFAYRARGADSFRAFPWSRTVLEHEIPRRRKVIAQIEACTRCRECEARCPYGLPVMEMLRNGVPAIEENGGGL